MHIPSWMQSTGLHRTVILDDVTSVVLTSVGTSNGGSDGEGVGVGAGVGVGDGDVG